MDKIEQEQQTTQTSTEKKPVGQNQQPNRFNNQRRFSKGNRKQQKKKFCRLCAKGVNFVDYKDVETLKKYLTYNFKIVPRRSSGLCQKHQRMIANGIKRARIVALLPFIDDNSNDNFLGNPSYNKTNKTETKQ